MIPTRPRQFGRAAIVAPIAAVALLAACATPTPYQPLGAEGTRASGGYASQQIEQDRFRVRFVGNRLTDRERVENYLLYRAAELTVQQGYGCFTIVDRDVEREVETRVRPGVGFYPAWSPFWRFHGPWGWHFYDPWIGGAFLPGGYDVDTINRYEAVAEIVMERQPCAPGPATFDADQVIANLRPTIELPRQG